MKTFIRYIFLFLLSGSCYAQSLSDLTTDNSSKEINLLLSQAVISVYDQTLIDFNTEIEAFTMTLTKSIERLGGYSEESSAQFDQECQDELDRATKEIRQISHNSILKYYDELKDKGISSGVGVTDPLAQKLDQDIDTVEFDMINEMKSVISILQFDDPLPKIGQEVKTGVDAYQKLAAEEYVRQEKKASQAKKTSQWQDIKLAGADFFGFVKTDLEAECKVALTEALTDTLKDIGNDAAAEVSKYGKSLIS